MILPWRLGDLHQHKLFLSGPQSDWPLVGFRSVDRRAYKRRPCGTVAKADHDAPSKLNLTSELLSLHIVELSLSNIQICSHALR
jgi:hypothetical protein